ncbi:E2-like enzyme, partial [Linderina pennispora]
MSYGLDDEVEQVGDEGWVTTYARHRAMTTEDEEAIEEIKGIEEVPSASLVGQLAEGVENVRIGEQDLDRPLGQNDIEDIPSDLDDIPDFEEEMAKLEALEDADPTEPEPEPAAKPASKTVDDSEDKILRTRTYDVSISYDKYYQTPR